MPEPIDVDVTGRRIPERPAIATGAASNGSKVAADDGEGDHLAGARVYALDDGLRLDRGRAERSSCYSKMLERLADGGRACVEIMETRLFARRLRVADCVHDGLLCPNGLFKCPEGSIWYHYSPRRRKFVLSFFHIDGRGGGLPAPRHVEPMGGVGRWLDADLRDSIAALLGDADRPVRPLDIAARLRSLDDDSISDWAADAVPSVEEGNCMQHAPVLRDAAWLLPEWSLLACHVHVHQQLDNPYARAILMGEVTCRIGLKVGAGAAGRALRLGPAGGWVTSLPTIDRSSPVLLHECHVILDGVLENGIPEEMRSNSRHFLTASLMDREFMADGRRLALVRGELIYRLAMSVVDSGIPPSSEQDTMHVSDQSERMRRYALLTEFICMSDSFFGPSQEIRDADVLLELTDCPNRRRPILKAIAQDIIDFDLCSMLVADMFVKAGWRKDAGGGRSDRIEMHDRLSRIASQLLTSKMPKC